MDAYLDTRAVCERALELHHGTGDLVSNAGLAADWCSGVCVCCAARSPSTASSGGVSGCGVAGCGVSGWVAGGGRLDCAGVGVSASETSHCLAC